MEVVKLQSYFTYEVRSVAERVTASTPSDAKVRLFDRRLYGIDRLGSLVSARVASPFIRDAFHQDFDEEANWAQDVARFRELAREDVERNSRTCLCSDARINESEAVGYAIQRCQVLVNDRPNVWLVGFAGRTFGFGHGW